MKFLSFLLISTLATINANLLNVPNCGTRPYSAAKIVNGQEAARGDWGWQVSLTNNGRHFCGGSLINDQWVISAAHCFQFPFPQPSQGVEIGLHNRFMKESYTVSRRISTLHLHESFSMQNMRNDIALLRLSSPVQFRNEIVPVCLPSRAVDITGRTGWLTGWGLDRFGGNLSNDKMQVSMDVLPDTRCQQIYSYMYSTQAMICCGEFNVNKGACQGDSGGPFVMEESNGKWYLYGLTSWGRDCGKGTVFTRVTSYLSWIQSKISYGGK